jgi:hypothetical protein
LNTITETSLALRLRRTPVGLAGLEDAELTMEEWAELGEQLARSEMAVAWWVGDWAFYGHWRYGQQYDEIVRLTGLDEKTVRCYRVVAGSFSLSRRRDNLSFQHHNAVASLTIPEQEHWLNLASEKQWSMHTLRAEVRAERERRKHELPAPSPAPPSPPEPIEVEVEPEDEETVRPISLYARNEEIEGWRMAADKAGLDMFTWARRILNEAALRAA